MQTVVGVFDSVNEAENARESLLSRGFDESAVSVQSQSQSQSQSAAAQGRDSVSTASREDEGFMASVGRFFSDLFGGDDEHAGNYSEAVRRGSSVVVVTVPDESQVESARAALAAAGAVDIDKRAEDWRQSGYSGFDPASRPLGADEVQAERGRFQSQNLTAQADKSTVLPVIREDIEIGKREVDLGTVRVHTRTEVRPVQEQVQLREERAEIERRNVDRPASEADLKAFEGGSIEVREMAERAVVSKTARVVEEVVVGTQATTRTETVTGEVRNTVVDIDNSAKNSAADMQAGAPDYRSHYERTFASAGGSFDEYEPAYKYGSTLRSDTRYASRSWTDVEADAQRDWSGRNPNSSWERVKDAVRHGWETVTGQR